MIMMNGVFYDDGLVALGHDGITMRRYYFPFGTSKRIPYARIRNVREWRMGPFTGKGFFYKLRILSRCQGHFCSF